MVFVARNYRSLAEPPLGGSKVRSTSLHHMYAKEKTEAWRFLEEKLETLMP